jgi:hypothetical protein
MARKIQGGRKKCEERKNKNIYSIDISSINIELMVLTIT